MCFLFKLVFCKILICYWYILNYFIYDLNELLKRGIFSVIKFEYKFKINVKKLVIKWN